VTRLIVNSNGTKRIRAFLNILALKPVKVARKLGACSLCACAIHVGDKYRGEIGNRAHEDCFQAVNSDFSRRGK
jgi:hypothetical protein